MLTSIREMAEFPELINCCLSFIFHLHCLLLQLWMRRHGRRAEQAWRQQRAHPQPEAKGGFHLSTGKVQLCFQLQGLFSTGRYMALADKSPVRQEHLKVRDIENTQSSSDLHQAVFTEKEKPGESFFIFERELPRIHMCKLQLSAFKSTKH